MTKLLLLILSATVVCVIIVSVLRAKKTAQWRAERRSDERRNDFRRVAVNRRNEVRQRHDDRHNADRRFEERREIERRDGQSWEEDYDKLKSRLEERQRDNRNM